MSKINILTDETIGKIAAGEVVERPASVVKELIENSIDAGSSSIEIELKSSGQSLIRVADNGKGMAPEDAKIACKRHTTSKIKDASDLESINTLGFRGEALASISAVSQMDITSRSDSEKSGIYAYLESGEIQTMRPAARMRGTTVEVRNLFYNVPARKKFLKRETTELAEIVNVVGRFIIACPDLEFKLTHDERLLLYASKSMDMIERISLVLGGDISGSMIKVSKKGGKYGVGGYVSLPASTRKDKRAQMFFLNSRYVRSKLLSDAVYDAYRSLLERGRYPAAVIFLKTPPEEVDVNVHPTKLQVKFENESAVKESVAEAIKAVFGQIKQAEETESSGISKDALEEEAPEVLVFPEVQEQQNEFSYELKNTSPSRGKVSFGKDKAQDRTQEHAGDIYQVGRCYIVQIKPDGITVTDQHAAHERILYELFSKASEGSPLEGQNLLFPLRLDLSASEAVIMSKFLENFLTLGFQIEPFGDKSFIVQAAPAVLKDRDIKTVIHDVLTDLSECKDARIDRLDELVKITACRAAIKEGDLLGEDEMISLLEQLKKCSLPFTCPHGRPTTFDVTVSELEERFHRSKKYG